MSRACDVVVVESSDDEGTRSHKTKHNKVDSVIVVDDSDNDIICEQTLKSLPDEQVRARTDSVILISQPEKYSSPLIEQKSEPNFSRGKYVAESSLSMPSSSALPLDQVFDGNHSIMRGSKIDLMAEVTTSVKRKINSCLHPSTLNAQFLKRRKVNSVQEEISQEKIEENTRKCRKRKTNRTHRQRRIAKERAAARSEGVKDQPMLTDEPINDKLPLTNEIIATSQKGFDGNHKITKGSKINLMAAVTTSVKRKISNCLHPLTSSAQVLKRPKVNPVEEQLSQDKIEQNSRKKRKRKDRRTHRDRRMAKKRAAAQSDEPMRDKPMTDEPMTDEPMTDEPMSNELCFMTQVVLVDFDNWKKLFDLDVDLPEGTFVWGFYGPLQPLKSTQSPMLQRLISKNCFYLHPQCGRSKNAADFALCCTAGRLDVKLPKNIPFTILSGDRGFEELRRQLSRSSRESLVVDPHHMELEMVISILKSIGDR